MYSVYNNKRFPLTSHLPILLSYPLVLPQREDKVLRPHKLPAWSCQRLFSATCGAVAVVQTGRRLSQSYCRHPKWFPGTVYEPAAILIQIDLVSRDQIFTASSLSPSLQGSPSQQQPQVGPEQPADLGLQAARPNHLGCSTAYS